MVVRFDRQGEDVLRGRQDTALTMSRMFAENENKRVDLGLDTRSLTQQKLNADLQISRILINRSGALSNSLQSLITTVKGTVATIDALNNVTRDSFVDSMRAVDDPRTGTMERLYHYGKMTVITLLNQRAGL